MHVQEKMRSHWLFSAHTRGDKEMGNKVGEDRRSVETTIYILGVKIVQTMITSRISLSRLTPEAEAERPLSVGSHGAQSRFRRRTSFRSSRITLFTFFWAEKSSCALFECDCLHTTTARMTAVLPYPGSTSYGPAQK